MSCVEKAIWILALKSASGEAEKDSFHSLQVLKGTEEEDDNTPMSRLEIYASLCCFRVQHKFIQRVLREQTHSLVTHSAHNANKRGGVDRSKCVGWKRMAEVADWPLVVGWLKKKGRKDHAAQASSWKPRWYSLLGPFLLYYENPEDQVLNKLLNEKDQQKVGFMFLSDFEVSMTTVDQVLFSADVETQDGEASPRFEVPPRLAGRVYLSFKSLDKSSQWFDTPMLVDVLENSTHRIDQWFSAIRAAVHLGKTFMGEDREAALASAVARLQCIQTTRVDTQEVPAQLVVADASIGPAFAVASQEEQTMMLAKLSSIIKFPANCTLDLTAWRRQLIRIGCVEGLDMGSQSQQKLLETVFVLLFEDVLLVVSTNKAFAQRKSQKARLDSSLFDSMTYRHHQLLTEDTQLAELSSGVEFSVKTGARSYKFRCKDRSVKGMWLHDISQLLLNRDAQHNTLERYKGAVIFADVSGFSNLGDALERREQKDGSNGATNGRATAAEELARILGKEIQKMVEAVTKGGGDVIKFAGDCIIAVFPEQDYADLSAAKKYGALALATGQAVRITVQMMHAKNLFILQQEQMLNSTCDGDGHLDEIGKLVGKLNIHIAIGSGDTFGYHVGGVDNKWDYLISGKVMEQVRSADHDAKAGEVVLSKEAFQMLKKIKMRHSVLPSGNVKLETYYGPTEEPKFRRPWEKLAHDKQLSSALADKLRAYVPKPIIDQVEAGNTLWLSAKKRISTIFCRLIGIDYVDKLGETAVFQLGEIVTQVQTILITTQGTLTRVISDDKGTSMLMAFDHPQHAVDAALEIQSCVVAIPGSKFRVSIGITTGLVYIGPVGGRIRAEFTMHGSMVNFSARLMTCPLIINTGGILCDAETVKLATRTIFAAQAPRHFKGFEEDYVSFMPTHSRPLENAFQWFDDDDQVEDETPEHLSNEGDEASTAKHSMASISIWTETLRPYLEGQDTGCVIAIETDLPGHWGVHDIRQAIITFRPRLEVANICFNNSDQELNRQHLQNLLDSEHTSDQFYILERADGLDETNWDLLHELVRQVESANLSSRRPADDEYLNQTPVGSTSTNDPATFMITIDRDSGHSGQTLPEQYSQVIHSLNVIHKLVHFAAAENSAARVSVAEEITLEVAAVLAAAPSATETPCFRSDVVIAAHPYVQNEAWEAAAVQEHIEALAAAGLFRLLPPADDAVVSPNGAIYEFVDPQIQQERYRQILHDNRSPIHSKAIQLLDAEVIKTADEAHKRQLYSELHFHLECIGDTSRARICARLGAVNSDQGGNETLQLIYAWQSQRRFNGKFSEKHLLRSDPPGWADRTGTESAQDNSALPPPSGAFAWQWASDWVEAINSGRTDENGWSYGSTFGQNPQRYFEERVSSPSQWSYERSPTAVVRYRKWFRVAQRQALASPCATQNTLSAPEARLIATQLAQGEDSGQAGASMFVGEERRVKTIDESSQSIAAEQQVATLEAENGRLQGVIDVLQARMNGVPLIPQAPAAESTARPAATASPLEQKIAESRQQAAELCALGQFDEASAQLTVAQGTLRSWVKGEQSAIQAEAVAVVQAKFQSMQAPELMQPILDLDQIELGSSQPLAKPAQARVQPALPPLPPPTPAFAQELTQLEPEPEPEPLKGPAVIEHQTHTMCAHGPQAGSLKAPVLHLEALDGSSEEDEEGEEDGQLLLTPSAP
eukprot:SAG11_NODE_606_length_8231_cov_5.017462_2_plen_1689_part_00